jgi:chromosomal replication initiation ATPase DnaA
MNALDVHKFRMELDFLKGKIDKCYKELREKETGAILSSRHGIKAKQILDAVGREFKIRPEFFCRKNAEAPVAIARQTAQFLLREIIDFSLPKIAKLTGMKDHTTVLHAIRKIRALRAANAEFDMRLRKLECELMDGGDWGQEQVS